LVGRRQLRPALDETADGMPQLGLSADDLHAIGRENALPLLPHFAHA